MGEKKTKINFAALAADTSPVEVCKAIGIKIYPKGQRNFICCPGHERRLGKRDLNPTNAVLTEHGYHCFACGVSISTADMITEYTGCTLREAFKLMAALNGGEELYMGEGNEKIFRLSDEEFEALNLNPMYESDISFSDICREDISLAKEIIGKRIEKMLPLYEKVLQEYSGEEGAWKLYDYAEIPVSKRNEMLDEVKKRMSILQRLTKIVATKNVARETKGGNNNGSKRKDFNKC